MIQPPPPPQAQAAGHEPVAEFVGHHGNINSVSWAPDSLHLASGADDCRIFIWDASPFDNAAPGIQGNAAAVTAVTDAAMLYPLSSSMGEESGGDGKEDAGSGSGNRDKERGGRLPRGAIAELEGHSAPVLATKFTFSGRCVVSSDFSGAVFIWSRAASTVLFSLSGHRGAVYALTISPGDSSLLTGGSDGCFRCNSFITLRPSPYIRQPSPYTLHTKP
jgi:WD40 repeat protein